MISNINFKAENMKKIIVFVFVLFFTSNFLIGQNSRDSLHTKIGFSIMLKSEHLEDSVKLFIHLPFCFKPQDEYPVIFLLDANSSFKAFASAAELMAKEKSIPCCIVVGFPQCKYVPNNKDNLEANIGKLMNFCGAELLPFLHSKFNITETIIWGQGHSGMISGYIMLEKPDLFDGYISDVPNFNLISEKVKSENVFDNLQDKNVNYYLFGSSAINFFNESFLNNLKSNAPQGLNWKYNVVDETNAIIHFLINYMHAIESFFNETK